MWLARHIEGMQTATTDDALLGQQTSSRFFYGWDGPGAGVISGTIECFAGDVFMTLTTHPKALTDTEAKTIVADGIIGGRTFGMRPAFAAKVKEAL